MNIECLDFKKTVLDYYNKFGRHDLPWRIERTPFNAFLSEIMLQQTQVPRVVEKFTLFKSHFKSFEEIGMAPQSKILTLWQGLGYNRRALYLHKAAQSIADKYNGVLPCSLVELQTLPGIGPATAASISVYAFNKPLAYIETNIRAVFIHHFFSDQYGVSDNQILPIVAMTLDHTDPYHWYSALMDYGTKLKSEHKNPSRRSLHHTKQSKFEGSKRQIRGKIIRIISELGDVHKSKLVQSINDVRCTEIINDLQEDGMIVEKGNILHLKK